MAETRHPALEQLAQLAAGMLGALERSRLERHVSECARCSTRLRQLTNSTSGRIDANPNDDANVLRRARRLLFGRDAEEFRAALRFDSATMPSAYGMRGGLDSTIRQLLFEAGPFEIELHTRAEQEVWSVSGQVLGPTEATSGEVRLIGTQANARSTLSELLEFTLPRVPAGRYRLEVHLPPNAVLHVNPLEIGS